MNEIQDEAYSEAMDEIAGKDAEIERLKDGLRQNADAQATFQTIVREQRQLITELTDWISEEMYGHEDPSDYHYKLLQKAREAIRSKS